MRNVLSVFPDGIDSRVYFSDINLENVSVMNQYQELIKAGRYTDASQLLNSNDNIFFYGAWVLNMFENRLRNTGKYLLSKEKTSANIYQPEEPTENLRKNLIWIGD